MVPLNNRSDYKLSIPNKPIEYLANSLPILSSLKGELHNLIETESIGFNYRNGEELEKIINSQLSNKDRELIINAKKLYLKKFTAEVVYSDYEFFLSKLLSFT